MSKHYILNDRKQIVETDLMTWAAFLQSGQHVVKQEKVGSKYKVSTVFLGLDYNFSPHGPPILWETAVLGDGPLKGEMTRCAGTIEQAEAMHQTMVERVMRHP